MRDPRDPAELLVAAADGDQAAWDELEFRFGPRMWAVARACGLSRTEAADAVQGAWLRLLQHLESIRDPARVGSWLTTTVRREALLLLRKQTPRVSSSEVVENPDPASTILETDDRRLLWRMVSDLHEPCRTLLRLVAIDLGNQQVASRLGMPAGSVGPAKARCLEKLRTLLSLQETAQ
ncbi:RNA polymerase sigma factor [Nonomuraea purpurea]|uniref:RNA polymerase sigma factor n=1 Tax=Nonomuraea purpurea TaxID=1849276 RepID=A0ABV8G073_9ACTN